MQFIRLFFLIKLLLVIFSAQHIVAMRQPTFRKSNCRRPTNEMLSGRIKEHVKEQFPSHRWHVEFDEGKFGPIRTITAFTAIDQQESTIFCTYIKHGRPIYYNKNSNGSITAERDVPLFHDDCFKMEVWDEKEPTYVGAYVGSGLFAMHLLIVTQWFS